MADSIVTFSSLTQVASFFDLDTADAADKAKLDTLTAAGTLTFQQGADGKWDPVVAKRSGTGSFSNMALNTLTYVELASWDLSINFTVGGNKDAIQAMSSEDQRALIYQYGTTDAATGLMYLEVGPTTGGIPAMTLMLGEKGQVIVADQLDNRAIAKLTASEQQLLAKLAVFTGAGTPKTGGLQQALGLVTTVPASVQAALTEITNMGTTSTTLTKFTTADQKVFLDQIKLIQAKLASQGIYHQKTIDDEIAAILTRFKTAHAYGSVDAETGPHRFYDGQTGGFFSVRYNNVISLDGGAAVKAGYENFMAQERRLLELAQTRADMKASTAGSKNLDVPTMVVRFQLYYNLETEALVNIKSEEVKQQNELLKTYAEIQRRVSELAGQNRTVNYFYGGSNHAEFQKDNYNNNASNPEALFDKFGIASMFNSHNENYGLFARSANHGQVKQPLHPLETLRGITRPKLDIFYDGGSGRSEWGETLVHSASQWSAFGTRLGDAVTLINQESQIQMNDISALEKEKNRFYEAGSNALSRLNEAILGIGRNV